MCTHDAFPWGVRVDCRWANETKGKSPHPPHVAALFCTWCYREVTGAAKDVFLTALQQPLANLHPLPVGSASCSATRASGPSTVPTMVCQSRQVSEMVEEPRCTSSASLVATSTWSRAGSAAAFRKVGVGKGEGDGGGGGRERWEMWDGLG